MIVMNKTGNKRDQFVDKSKVWNLTLKYIRRYVTDKIKNVRIASL